MAMTATLEALVHCCHGDERPDCPILATLADEHVDPPPKDRAERKAARSRGQRA